MQLFRRFFFFPLLLIIPALVPAAQFSQQAKLVPTVDRLPASGVNYAGWSVSLSADGNTALVGAPGGDGRAWLWNRSAGVWTQGFGPLFGTDHTGAAMQGSAVALSPDGNTAIIGGSADNGSAGAAWIWTRNGSTWVQQGNKLVGAGGVVANQGFSVALSADGNTALVGGPADSSGVGAAWVFTRSGTTWTQQGGKLVGSGAGANAGQGISVALSADGNTAAVGGFNDRVNGVDRVGAIWVWTRTAGAWTQQGSKLSGTGATVNAAVGSSVGLAGDGNTLIAGGSGDSAGTGAAWVWTRSGSVWTQQGSKLVGTGALSAAQQGFSVALSSDGNTAAVGGNGESAVKGAIWVWTRTGGTWTQVGAKLVGPSEALAAQGTSVSLSSDGATVLFGGPYDNSYSGAAWVFGQSGISHFAVSAPTSATNGTAFNFTVTAQDVNNIINTTYNGTIHFTSSDSSAILPADATLSNGTGSFSATLRTNNTQTITATDTVNASVTGTSGTILVGGGSTVHFVIPAPANATAGTPVTITINVRDALNSPVNSYSGTVHFTSSDPQAVLPANAVVTNGSTFSVTLKTAGSQTITATDTASSATTGTTNVITVGSAAATHLTVTAPATAIASTPFNLTVAAQDAFNNTSTTYAGTVHFSSGDPAAVLPGNTTLSSGTGTFSAALKTTGAQSITATDTVNSSVAGNSGNIQVSAGQATKFAVIAPPATTPGTQFNLTVIARDAANNTITTYTGTVHFTSSDGQAVLPANATLTNGTGVFSATLKTAGSQSITATDTVNSAITGSSGAITVGAATNHFSVTTPAATAPGAPFSVTVTALDAANNTLTGYGGTVHFTSSDAQAVLPANTTLTNGVTTLQVILKTSGSQYISVADTVTASFTGSSGIIVVGSGTATRFAITAPSAASAGTSFNIIVTAQDALNNIATGYSGIVHFTSSDSAAILPGDALLSNGTGSTTVTLKTGGTQTITATDTASSAITGSSAGISVSVGAATHLAVSAPASAASGSAFLFTVSAQDALNNTVGGYTGTVHFTSSDGQAVLPANATLTNGTGSFSATLKTSGNQSITATDVASASLTGSSGNIAVTLGSTAHFAISAPGSVTAGAAFSFTVTARDSADNVLTSYAGTVHFTSSDGTAVLPANATLTNGTGTFSATLNTFGNQFLTATDTASSAITGQSGTVAVGGGTAPTGANPGSGSSYSKSMTFTFTDPRGWQDLDVVNVLINNFLDGRNACYLAYSRSSSVLYLVSDGGGTLLPGLVLNGTGSVNNGQCTVTGSGSSATGNGNTLTLTLDLTFSAGFTGHKVTYMAARDLQGGNSGWQALGTWEVPGTVWSGPYPVGLTPARSSGSGTQSLAFQFADTNGWPDLGILNILINDALDGNHACYLAYDRANNVLYLVNDTGNGLLPGLVINGSGTLSNGQCTITGAGSSVAAGGNNLILTLNLSFTPGFAGNRVIYMAARSNGDVLNSGWRAEGSRTVK